MDMLSKYAQFLTRNQAPVMMDDGGVMFQLYKKKPKLETDLSFDGAEITVPLPQQQKPVELPPRNMEASEVVEMAPRTPEEKSSVLDRYRSDFGTILEMSKPDPERVRSIDRSLEEIRSKSRQRVQRPDFDAIRAKYQAESGPGDWEASDYLKAALVAALPALAGGLAGGFAGAAGGAPAGVKGIDYALRSREDAKKKSKETADKEIQTALDIYKADQDMAGKELKMLLDRADLEIKLQGKLSEPTQKILEQALSSLGSMESSLYGTEMRDRQVQEGQLLADAQAADRVEAGREAKGYELGLRKEQQEADRALKKEQAEADRALRKELADAERAARERMAKQKAAQQSKAKAEKPPTAAQSKSAGYVIRMQEADDTIDKMFRTEKFDATKRGLMVRELPAGDKLFQVIQNPDAQKYYNAVRAFVNSILREESGAAIAESEFASAAAQYFPQPGDTNEVIEQKRRNRKTAIAGKVAEAGNVAVSRAEQALGDVSVQDPVVKKFADQFYQGNYDMARRTLMKRGYQPKERRAPLSPEQINLSPR